MTSTVRTDQTEDRLSVDAGQGGLLAAFGGARPPAPAWFDAAIADEPERGAVEVDGARIETLTWGQRGRPGLVFLHGNGAHAEWWRFIAPAFAANWRILALTWSGMGGSDWRPAYSGETFAREVFAAAEAGGLHDSPLKPTLVAHSFGGFVAMHCAARYGDRLRAAVLVDSAIDPPGRRHDGPPRRERPNRIYPTFEATLARFRLAPPQDCENLFAVDFIGRHSIKEVEGGFTWKFDPFLWRNFELGDLAGLLQDARCPVALMWGARSGLVTPEVAAYMAGIAPPGTPLVPIPDADHHVMLDQPLAFTAALTGLLAVWPAQPPR